MTFQRDPSQSPSPSINICSVSIVKFAAHRMDTSNAIASPSAGRVSEDALKVLGRVADAFDNPSLQKTDKGLLFVNVVKSDRVLTSLSSEDSMYQDATHGSCDSSFSSGCDEDVELVVLGDVSVWEHASSYPYASRRYQSHEPRSPSEKIVRKGDGMYDITKMLLTSSPLDRLDRLARMELKKTGWFERTDKWSIVEMGLQRAPLPITPPKTPSKKAGFQTGESRGRFSMTKTTSPNGERQTPYTLRQREIDGEQASKRGHGYNILGRRQHRGDAIKFNTPTSTLSPVRSEESDSYLLDFSTLSYDDAPRTNTTTPLRTSQLPRTHPRPQAFQQQARGRLGQAVRNFVKKMLPPSSGGGAFTRSTSCPRTRHTGNVKGTCRDSPSALTYQVEMTPRSHRSGESAWTFASAGSWMEAGAQGCLDYQATNRWSGFWH